MSRRFLIKLNTVHEKSGKSVYRAAKESGVAYNTVKKYVTGWVETDKLSPEVAQLAEFYGVDWRDPAVIEIINDDGADTRPVNPISEDEIKSPLAAPA